MSVVDFYHSKKEVGKSMKQYQESKKHHIGKQYMWLVIWILIALVCNGIVFLLMGKTHAVDFLGGYITELSLSIDNVFVFLMIFMGFNLGEKAQHRVLAWGIIGAIILRFIFVFFGDVFIFRGRGWGHGIGLFQWGALTLAGEGWTAERILEHYYPGTHVKSSR